MERIELKILLIFYLPGDNGVWGFTFKNHLSRIILKYLQVKVTRQEIGYLEIINSVSITKVKKLEKNITEQKS